MKGSFAKKHIKIVAALTALSMLSADAFMYGIPSESAGTDGDMLITEEHELPVAYADGRFDSKGSDFEDGTHAKQEYSIMEEKEGNESFGLINILEIVPDERMGFMGYTIGGCEPLGETSEEKEWIMDAMANNSAGSEYNSWQNPFFKDKFTQFVSATAVPCVTYEEGYYTGYFKKVGTNHGLYALGNGYNAVQYNGDKVKNVVMVSKFATNAESHVSTYDYVWVESEKDKDGNYIQKDKYTSRSELEAGEPIYVYNYKKTKYLNNEMFLTTLYPVSVEHNGVTYTADGEHGAYNIENLWSLKRSGDNSYNKENRLAAKYYKEAHDEHNNTGVKLFTRTPKQLQETDNKDLIKNVDLIILATSGDTAYERAMDAYKRRYEGTDLVSDEKLNINNRAKYEKNNNDLTFEQVLEIYDRVVVQKDLAIVCSHYCLSQNNGNTGLNIWKLMYMLFLVNRRGEDYNASGSGREIFMNFLEKYKNEIPDVAKARANMQSNDDFKSLKGYDIVKIDDEGKMTVNSEYSGWLFEKMPDTNGEDYGIWDYSGSEKNEWSASLNQDWLLGEVEGRFYSRNGDSFQERGKGKNSFPLYRYFSEKEQYYCDWNIHFNGGFTSYQNQMAYNDNGSLFLYNGAYDKGGAHLIKSVLQEKKKKIPEGSKTLVPVTKAAYMSMNIVNGDAVRHDSGGNKIIYVNEYELDKLEKINFNFEVRSTHPISKMELYDLSVSDVSPIAEYTFGGLEGRKPEDPFGPSNPGTQNYTGPRGAGELKVAPDRSGETPPGKKNPDDTIEGLDDPVWTFEGTINVFAKDDSSGDNIKAFVMNPRKKNTTLMLKVYGTVTVSVGDQLVATDTITVVKREFFPLQ